MSRECFKIRKLSFSRASDVMRLAKMPFTGDEWKGFKTNMKNDRQRLFETVKILGKSTREVLEDCFPEGTPQNIIDDLNQSVKFDHMALLMVSPIEFLRDWLKENSFHKAISFPSAIVSKRLGNRYLGSGEIPTTIVKAEKGEGEGKLEIFIPQTTDKNLIQKLVKKDVSGELERHFAFMPRKKITEKGLQRLIGLIETNNFVADGGGVNPTEGLKPLYFTRAGKDGKPVRIELICQG